MENLKSEPSDSAVAIDIDDGSRPFWSSPSLRELLSSLHFSEPKCLISYKSKKASSFYRKESLATNDFLKVYRVNADHWRTELGRHNIFYSNGGRVIWDSATKFFPAIEQLEQFYKDPEEDNELFFDSQSIDNENINEKLLQITNCKANPFRFDFKVMKIISERACVLSGHVKHGFIEVGDSAFVLFNSQIRNVKIIDAANVGVRIKKIYAGLFPEILVEHEVGHYPESGVLMDEDALSEAPKWFEFSKRQNNVLKSIQHRNKEIIKLKNELRANLNLLLDRGSPREFEELVADLFGKIGGTCTLTPPSRDGGKDIIVKLNGEKYFVECKLFSKDNKVGRPLIQKLAGVVATEKAAGIFVTTSSYTESAIEYAKKASIDLWDFDRLSKIIAEQLPNNNLNYPYTAVCLECGGLAEFDLLGNDLVSACPEGHEVTKTISLEECGYKPK